MTRLKNTTNEDRFFWEKAKQVHENRGNTAWKERSILPMKSLITKGRIG